MAKSVLCATTHASHHNTLAHSSKNIHKSKHQVITPDTPPKIPSVNAHPPCAMAMPHQANIAPKI